MSNAVERFRGPDYLTGFEPDPDALNRLRNDPETATQLRLARRAQGASIVLRDEDLLRPLVATEGDVVLRVVNPPGNLWAWWAGDPLDNDFFHCVSALAHYHEHKIVSRRSGHPTRLVDRLHDGGTVIPVHWDNVPESVWEMMKTDPPYRERERGGGC